MIFSVAVVMGVLGKGLPGIAHPIEAESGGIFRDACSLLLGRAMIPVKGQINLMRGLVSSRVEHVTSKGDV